MRVTWFLNATGCQADWYLFLGLAKGSRVAKWGFYLSPTAPTGEGLGSIMCYLGLCYGFESLRLHKVVGEVLSSEPLQYCHP